MQVNINPEDMLDSKEIYQCMNCNHVDAGQNFISVFMKLTCPKCKSMAIKKYVKIKD